MPVFKTAYDTTACKDMQLEKTKTAVLEAKIRAELDWTECSGLYSVRRNFNAAGGIPSFAHPMALHFRGDELDSIVIDLRDMIRLDPNGLNDKIVSENEYELMMLRGILNTVWLNRPGQLLLRDISPLAVTVYSAWISQSIARRFSLEPHEQLKLAMLSAYFYCKLFTPAGTDYSERDKLKMSAVVSNATKCSAQDAMTMFEELDELDFANIHDFTKHMERVTGSIRLREMNAGVLVTIIGGTWFNSGNVRELLAVALEHPPTWLAILTMAFTSRAYKKTFITGLTELYDKRDHGQQFVRAVDLVTNRKK